MAELAFQCECGQILGTVADAGPALGTHGQCYCSDCRAGEVYAGAADPAPEPVRIYQTSPHLLEITQGHDRLGIFSYGPRNLLRWRATCCGCTMFNTPRNPKLSFVGIQAKRLLDPSVIGPVTASAFQRLPNGRAKHWGLRGLLTATFMRVARNRWSGRWKDNPLYHAETGHPVADVTVISWAARQALLAK